MCAIACVVSAHTRAHTPLTKPNNSMWKRDRVHTLRSQSAVTARMINCAHARLYCKHTHVFAATGVVAAALAAAVIAAAADVAEAEATRRSRS